MIALEPGSTLGGYRILARLRAGSMGVLYLARRAGHAGFSRPVAIKVIHDHLAQNRRFCRMFIDEAKLSARIDDPNVVRVEEFGQADGRYYLVMEYVHGASLAQTIAVLRKRGRIPVEQAVAIAMQIAGGLHGAHEATDEQGVPLGIVHRDVSPHNVVVSYKGYVRVIDFGIAKARQVGGETKTGSLRGKLAYMPPEQARSARTVDRRADLYGVGLILWEMLTFRRVFDADTDIAILNQIREPDIVPPSRLAPAVTRALDAVVMRTLANDPDERPATGEELQRALADAVPGALRVMPSDLAALMKKVRAAADAMAAGGPGDDAALYGEEVRGTLMTFGASMHESVEQAESLDTRPSRPDTDELGPPSSGARGAPSGRELAPRSARPLRKPAEPEQTSAMLKPPVAPPLPPRPSLRPGDGVRAVAAVAPGVPALPIAASAAAVSGVPGSSPDLLIPPPPLSSSRNLTAAASGGSSGAAISGHPSSSDHALGRASFPSLPHGADGPHGASVPTPAPSPPKLDRDKLLAPILASVALLGAVTVGIVVVVQSQRAPPPAPVVAPRPRESAPAKPAPAVTLQAPVVIAPPAPLPDASDDAASPGGRTRKRP